jgi:hypothetical protein
MMLGKLDAIRDVAVIVPADWHRPHRWLAMVHVRRLAARACGRIEFGSPSTTRSKGETSCPQSIGLIRSRPSR